ncbi:DUF2523 domain-containing protein [Aquitalea magnusonii]|uniref:DUF2523 domain-containing protein n=1 Tax=Aquitalea magnusonii TaxID=332411 RepID=UPI0007500D57|nr:DUF2523 domain-containing protein [Aquitalea magnusonii]
MPAWLIPVVWGVISSILSALIARILTAIGVGSVTFIGVNLIVGKLKSAIMGFTSGFGSDAVNILGMSGLGVCFSLLFSAYTIRLTLAGMDKAGNYSQIKFSGFGGK